MPFVMTVNALFMLTTIGGITVTAIRLGRGDHAGANQAFMHSLTGTLALAIPALSGRNAALDSADPSFGGGQYLF